MTIRWRSVMRHGAGSNPHSEKQCGFNSPARESRVLVDNATYAKMKPAFSNVFYEKARSQAYAELEFPGTYYLAYRDLPTIISKHVRGRKALDFVCGAGRSTRFLRKLGFDPVGMDISQHMLARARERDPKGEYHVVRNDDLSGVAEGAFDLVGSLAAGACLIAHKSTQHSSHKCSIRRILLTSDKLLDVYQ